MINLNFKLNQSPGNNIFQLKLISFNVIEPGNNEIKFDWFCIILSRLVVGQYLGAGGSVVSHVNLTDVRSTDGGTYTCTASNIAGSTSHSARLNVYGQSFS